MRAIGQLCETLVLFGFAYVLLFMVYPDSRLWPVYLIEKNDRPKVGADAVILLMGDAADRTPEAARLWKEGYAKKIIFVESEKTKLAQLGIAPGMGEATYRYLTEFLNVPESAIIFSRDTTATSTREEADEIFKKVQTELPDAKRLILTTSWYHSRRAAWIFDRINKDRWNIESSPTPSPKRWYDDENSFISVFNEYLKWPYYIIHYGLG